MSNIATEQIRRREARVFARYLFRMTCPDAVVEAYVRFHEQYPARLVSDHRMFDRLLTAISKRRILLPLADSYAALFRPQGLLRKRIVLCLSLLECHPACDQQLQRDIPAGRLRTGCEVVTVLLAQGAITSAAILVLGPLDLITRFCRSVSRRGSIKRSSLP